MWRRRDGKNRRRSAESPAYFAVLDPGTSTLRLLIAEVQDGQANVWGWSEGLQRTGTDPGGDVESLVATCRDLLSRAEAEAQGRAGRWCLTDQILVGLPASLLRGRAWSLVQRRSRSDQPIDERELSALLGRTLRLAVNRLADPEDPHWLLVDAVPVTLTVDGRGVTDPVGFRGREIGATVFAALAHIDTVDAWQAVARALEFSTLTLAAAPLALTASLPGSQGVLVDMGGTATDLTWWRAGQPVVLGTLPIGGQSLTRSLSRKWKLSPSKAERLKRSYAAGDLAAEAEDQVSAALAPPLKTWLAEMERLLAGMDRDEPLPEQLLLTGGGAAVPDVAEAVRSLAWSEELHFVRYPQVNRVRPTDIAGVTNRTDLGRGPGDSTVLALAAWAARQGKPLERPARILNELCQAYSGDG